ncbi:MAG: hypothetical protein J6L77_06035 [Coprococcus sp.]|nr:hypothetical protein [Coprococcus sp.]
MASTKLIVLKSKEIIYTLIFLALVAVLVIILMIMFKGDKKGKDEEKMNPVSDEVTTGYVPGTYDSSITLGESTLSVMVTVDSESITDVSFKQLDESVMAMYPLLESSMEDINTQLQYVSSIDNLTYSSDNKYTATLIINAIRDALSKAVIQ